MNDKGYIDWLFSEDQKPYFEDANGLIQEGDKDTLLKPDGYPAHLQSSPDGWKDTLVKYGRNLTYWGLFRDMTSDMRFTKDGAKIIRHVMWRKGIEGIIYFAKHKINRAVYPTAYDAWYMGEIDLSQVRQIQNNRTIVAKVMEGGLSKLLKANENTTYDIRIDTDVNKKVLYLDGVPFKNKVEWTIYDGQQIYGQASIAYNWLGMGIVAQEGSSQGIIVQDVQFEENNSNFPNDFYFFWAFDRAVTVRVFGTIAGVCVDDNFGNDSNLILRLLRANGNTVVQEVTLPNASPYSKGETFSVDFDQTFTLNKNDRLHFRIAATPWTKHLFTVTGTSLFVEYEVTFRPTYCECLDGYTLAERIVEKVTGGKYGLKSTFLQGLNDILYTSGPALRKYQSEASIKTSLLDLMQELKLRSKKNVSVGLGIENNNIVIEELDYFFRDEIIMDLGIVDDLELMPANDLMFNTVKVGCRNQEIDKVNGRDEFNVTQKYSLPITKVVRELDLISSYRFDMRGIEVTRLDLYGKDTTDNKADNDTFVISAHKKDGVSFYYYAGMFQTSVDLGQYYIKIPAVLIQIQNGQKIIITGSASNNGTYTVVNTSYLVVGYTIVQVAEPLTNEDVDGFLDFTNDYMWILKRPVFSAISGLMHPAESFNILLSPKRGLIANEGIISPVCDKLDTKEIKFEVGDKNSELSTTESGVTITEKANIPVGSMTKKLFLPWYMKFTTAGISNFLEIMKTNPYGKVQFTDAKTGLTLYAYIVDGGIQPEPLNRQEWKVLACPGQDLTQLI